MEKAELDKLQGQPVDIAPWAYAWRADRAVQKKPEAYFIPRRLDRIDKVYRTAYAALSPDRLKSIAYANQPDLLKPFAAETKGPTAGGIALDRRLQRLQGRAPVAGKRSADSSPDAVEVRAYPTSWGWFGWTVDQILKNPEISADRRT